MKAGEKDNKLLKSGRKKSKSWRNEKKSMKEGEKDNSQRAGVNEHVNLPGSTAPSQASRKGTSKKAPANNERPHKSKRRRKKRRGSMKEEGDSQRNGVNQPAPSHARRTCKRAPADLGLYTAPNERNGNSQTAPFPHEFPHPTGVRAGRESRNNCPRGRSR